MELIASTMLQILAGTWFVVSTNFSMWLESDKTNPAFHYTIEERNTKTILFDEVTYIKKGKAKSIRGHDFQDKDNPNAFTWKGKGLLRIAKSKWEVKLIDEEHEWAVIYFSKTLFTPEGVDIISREAAMSPETLNEIKEKMAADPDLKEHIASLKEL